MKKTNNPLVSVCIPIYNCEEYIKQTIESVLAQTLSDWELIILDNSSQDKSLDIIKTYSDPRIRVVESDKNIGIEENWNKALAEAKGKYIKLLPADDYLLPDCLEKQTSVFDRPENRSVVLVCCGRNIIDQSGNFLIKRVFPGKKGLVKGRTAIRRVLRSGTNLLGEPGAVLFKREFLPQVGNFDGTLLYVIDVNFWLRTLLWGDLYVIPEPLCTFRLSPGSCSVEMTTSQSDHFSTFIRKLSEDPCYQVSQLDIVCGVFMSKILALGRRLFYLATVNGTAGNKNKTRDKILSKRRP